MSEEFQESANQSAPEVIESNEPSIQQEPAIEEAPATTQEAQQAFKVKYNKEEIEVPYEQAPDYIQKGMNYDKQVQRAEEYQQHLERVARLSGYQNPEELLGALGDLEKEQERQKYEQAGINPDKFKELVSELPEFQEMQQMKQQQQQNRQLQSEANELFTEFPDLTPEQIPQEAWNLKESRGLSLLDAYLRTTYKQLGQQKEQEAIQKLQQNQNSSPGSLGAGGEHQVPSVSEMSKSEFEALIQKVKRGEKTDF
ncbi:MULTISPECIES: hypothetical protein [unclassified Peribacillus]|uniref:hypothetical protein n=1 Tax=unclassified Peribacillus TaxID=2675266 RepID=UPI0036714653